MTERPEQHIQAHFVRAGRHGAKRRDWSLFFFFRIISEAASKASIDRILGNVTDEEQASLLAVGERPEAATADQLSVEFANPTLWSLPFAPAVSDAEVGFVDGGGPSKRFLKWLEAIAKGDREPFVEVLRKTSALFGEGPMRFPARVEESLIKALESLYPEGKQAAYGSTSVQIQSIYDVLASDRSDDHGRSVLKGRLVSACAYEIIRHLARAQQSVPVLRSAATEAQLEKGVHPSQSPRRATAPLRVTGLPSKLHSPTRDCARSRCIQPCSVHFRRCSRTGWRRARRAWATPERARHPAGPEN